MPGSRPAPGLTARAPGTAPRRLVGIDVARGIAVLGMFVAHFNPAQLDRGDWLQQLVSGRPAALFAVLAGISVALLSGGSRPRRGAALRADRARLATRAVLLFALGLALTSLGTPVKEILTAYGVLFLLAIPLLAVPPLILGCAGAALAVLGPIASFFLRSTVITGSEPGATPAFEDFLTGDGSVRVMEMLLVTGVYPVLTWLPFVLVGLSIGRLDLRSTAIRLRLLVVGSALAVLAHGVSWLLLNPLGGYARIAATLGTNPEHARDVATTTVGTVPTGDAAFLLTTAPHSGAPLEIFAATGAAMALIGAALLLAERFPRTLRPPAAVGALALTCYAGHVLVIHLIGYEGMVFLLTEWAYLPLLVLIVGTTAAAMAWRTWLGRGPLERLVHELATGAGKLVRRA
ncbi:DUF418 domain-containing protein [Saccharopolyspora elongata]|nr:DUF418 domain-containing protein [Saccharopolyspora elongata]